MPKKKKAPKILSWSSIENSMTKVKITPEQEEAKMRDSLYAYSVNELHADVLILKYVYNYTFEEIAKRLRIASPQSVQYILDSTLEYLKERDYE